MITLLRQYLPALLGGLETTAAMIGLISLVGLTIGVPLGALAARRVRSVRLAVQGAALLLSAVPTLVVLFWLHYPAQALLGIVVDPFITATVAISVVNTVFVAETVRNAVEVLPSDWIITARVLGLDEATTARRIVLPLAARQAIGPLLVTQVNMLHATLFSSFISVNELFRVAQRINSIEYDPINAFSLVAIFFLVICIPLHLVARSASSRFSRDLSLG